MPPFDATSRPGPTFAEAGNVVVARIGETAGERLIIETDGTESSRKRAEEFAAWVVRALNMAERKAEGEVSAVTEQAKVLEMAWREAIDPLDGVDFGGNSELLGRVLDALEIIDAGKAAG